MMVDSNLAGNRLDIVRRLSSEMVMTIAPDELEYFDDIFSAYLAAASDKTSDDAISKTGDNFGFSGGEILEFLTPLVIAAVSTGVAKFITALGDKKPPTLETKKHGDMSGKAGNPTRTSESDRLDWIHALINYYGIDRELFELLRARGIGSKRAREIVDTFIALIARDNSVIIRGLEPK